MEMIEVEAFVAIAQAGGFTRAAAVLHLSQPAVSRRIELLERELGAPLFERVRGGTQLTDAGHAFLPHAQRLLAAARDGAAAVQAGNEEASGTVTLALVGTLANTTLTARLAAFRAAYPMARLMLRTARSDEVGALVRQGEVHLGLRYFDDPHPDLTYISAGEESLRVIGAAQSRLVPGDAQTPHALAGVPWVAFPVGAGASGEPFARVLARQLTRAGLEDAEIVAIDSLTAQKRLVEADFGVGLLPESSVVEELRLGTVRVIPVAAMETTVPIMLVYRSDGYLTYAVRQLIVALTSA